MKETPILKIENLEKKFTGDSVLKNISFEVYSGELVALIGSSGSGKTTIMNCITNVIPFENGTIKISGKSVKEFKNRKLFAKNVGIIRQSLDLINNLTVINNVLIGRFNEWSNFTAFRNLFKTVDRDLALNALKEVGILEKASEKVKILSGGEKQRVAIARVILQNPKVILADEPVSSLDPVRTKEIIEILTKIVRDKEKCLIVGIHSVDLVKEYFDRVIGIRDGSIFIDKKVKDVTDEEFEILYKIKNEDKDEI